MKAPTFIAALAAAGIMAVNPAQMSRRLAEGVRSVHLMPSDPHRHRNPGTVIEALKGDLPSPEARPVPVFDLPAASSAPSGPGNAL